MGDAGIDLNRSLLAVDELMRCYEAEVGVRDVATVENRRYGRLGYG